MEEVGRGGGEVLGCGLWGLLGRVGFTGFVAGNGMIRNQRNSIRLCRARTNSIPRAGPLDYFEETIMNARNVLSEK